MSLWTIKLLFTALFPLYSQNVDTSSLEWKELDFYLSSDLEKALESPSKKSTLTFRLFNNQKNKEKLKTRVNQWLKDYVSYGFNLESHHPLKLSSGAKGFFVEAYHEELKQNFIQFMSLKEGSLATLTCKSKASEELKACKKALLTFTWKKDQETSL